MEAVVEIAVDAGNVLGEGVVWSPSRGEVLWTDIQGKTFWSYDPATGLETSTPLPDRLACFAPLGGARLLAAFAPGLEIFDLASGLRTPIAAIEADLPTTRINDGKLDRQGRLVFGTMDETDRDRRKIGSIWSYAAGQAPRVLHSGVGISNSICFSPDGRRMYFADTPDRTIRCFDYDTATGDLSNPSVFVEVEGPGYPDGSTVDSEGCLWNAEWGGGRIVRYTPQGRIDRVIALPCRQITCAAFGGPDLATLFVTSASSALDAAARAAQPHAGALFAVAPGVRGLADTPFRLGVL